MFNNIFTKFTHLNVAVSPPLKVSVATMNIGPSSQLSFRIIEILASIFVYY